MAGTASDTSTMVSRADLRRAIDNDVAALIDTKLQESQEASRLAVWNNSYQGQLAELALPGRPG